jgi:hypothetical protein
MMVSSSTVGGGGVSNSNIRGEKDAAMGMVTGGNLPVGSAGTGGNASAGTAGVSGGATTTATGVSGSATAATSGTNTTSVVGGAGTIISGGVDVLSSASANAAAAAIAAAEEELQSRTDVLTELENIANVTLSETGIFCSDTSYLDRVSVLQHHHVVKAKQRGYMEQR